MTLSVADFLQRWLRHVPVPQTRVVRSYGLSHAMSTEALALCRVALGQPPVVVPVRLDWQTVGAQRGEAHPERWPTCGQILVCTGVIPRGGAPPCLPSEERRMTTTWVGRHGRDAVGLVATRGRGTMAYVLCPR